MKMRVFQIFILDCMTFFNEAFRPGERFSEAQLVRQVLRSLLECFAIKVTTIEEAKDITTPRLDKLIGSLRAYELNLEEGKRDKLRGH